MIRVGLVGTSWWADAMYLPALHDHPHGKIVAICGRNPQKANEIAGRWHIPDVYTDYHKLIDEAKLDALIVATRTDTHFPIAMKAIESGLHVLCEKPVTFTYAEARQLADAADRMGVKHMVPFTYRFMPAARYLKELIDSGYIGTPYHMNMRYYTGYGRGSDYDARFDVGRSGPGAVADIGSHFLYLARWYFGEITGVTAQFGYMNARPSRDPDGKAYEVGDETAMLLVTFANGALGSITLSTLCYEGTPFGQTHHWEFHGSGGTLYSLNDWNTFQRITGTQPGQGPPRELPIPDRIWENARRDTVHNTYRDVFRKQDHMTRGFVTAIATSQPVEPTLHDGARVQQMIEASVKSHKEGRRVEVDSIGL